MTNKELENKIIELLPTNLLLKSVQDVNHKPHIYMIGPKHIDYANKHHNGMLGDETTNKVTCAYPGCNLYSKDHTSDKVVFLQLKENITKDEIQKALKTVVDSLPEKSFDGFSFVETPEKFRII